MRPEIQALRAIAVLAVLIFHLWPTRLPGGFVGVDVFFVVSGYLITAHLLREHVRTGRIALGRFWARRARRLLPASALVLLSTVAAIFLFVPPGRWNQFGFELIASALYVENWMLAWQSVDYMALSNVKSPTQHFWTLGVEEQFYLVWPVLLLAILALAAQRRAIRHGVLLGLGVVVAASLTHSVLFTAAEPGLAYFFTTTRIWEFGFGALLATVGTSAILRRLPAHLTAPLSWVGIGMIVVAMLTFGPTTPFPSYTALLPVVGTCLVIVTEASARRGSPTRLMRLRAVQLVGDVSYGVYLWHWPLIVLIPFAIGAELSTPMKFGIIVVSIALGWLSKVLVEDPLRTSALVTSSRPRWTFVAVLAGMTVLVTLSLSLARWAPTPAPSPEAAVAPCSGADAMLSAECDDPSSYPAQADLSSFAADLPPEDIRACEVSAQAAEVIRCDSGTDDSPRVALLGDSHATRWTESFRVASEDAGWTLTTFLISGCPAFADDLIGTAWGYPETADNCRRLSVEAIDDIVDDPTIRAVVLTNRTRLYLPPPGAPSGLTEQSAARTIERLQAAGKTVIVMKDPPEMSAVPPQGGESAADCLTRVTSPSECSLARDRALFDDPVAAAARATGAGLIDLDDLFCDAERCHSLIGGLVVYTDDNHVTRSFAASSRPALAARLGSLLPSAE